MLTLPLQIMEAKSINKSLSALGDVISALSTEQQFIPYRNNVLTELMQARQHRGLIAACILLKYSVGFAGRQRKNTHVCERVAG